MVEVSNQVWTPLNIVPSILTTGNKLSAYFCTYNYIKIVNRHSSNQQEISKVDLGIFSKPVFWVPVIYGTDVKVIWQEHVMVVTCFLENVLFLINFVNKHIDLQVYINVLRQHHMALWENCGIVT